MQNSLWLNTVLSSVEVVSVQWGACMYGDIIVSYAHFPVAYMLYITCTCTQTCCPYLTNAYLTNAYICGTELSISTFQFCSCGVWPGSWGRRTRPPQNKNSPVEVV